MRNRVVRTLKMAAREIPASFAARNATAVSISITLQPIAIISPDMRKLGKNRIDAEVSSYMIVYPVFFTDAGCIVQEPFEANQHRDRLFLKHIACMQCVGRDIAARTISADAVFGDDNVTDSNISASSAPTEPMNSMRLQGVTPRTAVYPSVPVLRSPF